MQISEMEKAIESILFAIGEPVSAVKIAKALECDVKTVLSVLKTLMEKYSSDEYALCIKQLGDSYQMCSKKEYGAYIRNILEQRREEKLSETSIETLAIIAYNQPVTKAFIEQIRGVDSGYVVNNLVEKGLVSEVGKLDVPGRPKLYATSETFLRVFGVSKLSDLPELPNREDDQMQLKISED